MLVLALKIVFGLIVNANFNLIASVKLAQRRYKVLNRKLITLA